MVTISFLLATLLSCHARAANVDGTPGLGDWEETVDMYFVGPKGNDRNSGAGPSKRLRTIQQALEFAGPGDLIFVAPGVYDQDVQSVRSGWEAAPIRIMGSPGTVIRGSGNNTRIVEISHSYIQITNITLDGRHKKSNKRASYRDKLLYIKGIDATLGVTGLKILNVNFRNAGGECLRMKYFAHGNEVAYSSFRDCGVWDFRFDGGGKNGEAVYIGTAPEQLDRNPTQVADHSNGNWVHHNNIDTRGNECVDIKEHASLNVIEYNICTGQLDPKAAGISVRGNENIIRGNVIFSTAGAGVRIGGDTALDGINNTVVGNTLSGNAGGPVEVLADPQAQICENRLLDAKGATIGAASSDPESPSRPCAP